LLDLLKKFFFFPLNQKSHNWFNINNLDILIKPSINKTTAIKKKTLKIARGLEQLYLLMKKKKRAVYLNKTISNIFTKNVNNVILKYNLNLQGVSCKQKYSPRVFGFINYFWF